jgi:hypothetical protein
MTRWVQSRRDLRVIRSAWERTPENARTVTPTGLSPYWRYVLNGPGNVRRVPVIAAYILIQTSVGSAACALQ